MTMADRQLAICRYKVLPSLPDDIMRTHILTRLDVKSLLRFRCVCKLWNSVICDADFIKNHLYCTTQNPNDDNLVITKDVSERDCYGKTINQFGYLAILTSSNLSETNLMDVPYSQYGSAEIDKVGSINGLVCLFHSNRNLDQFIIWNPAIRQAMKNNLPARQAMESHLVMKSFLGFCWDAMESDFKVVISYYETYHSPLILYVYSCNLGSWSSPRNSTFSGVFWPNNEVPSAIVMGVPYWTFSSYSSGTQHLIKYDFESKDFRVLPDLSASKYHYVRLVNLKDSLSALVYGGHSYDYNKSVDVYRLDERRGFWNNMYSVGPIIGDEWNRGFWRKMCSGIQMFNEHTPIYDEAVLSCFKNGGEIVFSARGISTSYRCYNHKTYKVTDLQNQKGYIDKCFSYKTSLIVLEGMKPQHQVEPTLWN